MSAKSKFNRGPREFQLSAEVVISHEATAANPSENDGLPQACDVINLPPANGWRLHTSEVAGEPRPAAGLWLPLTGQHFGEKLAFVKALQPLFYGDYAVILKDGSRLNMSRSYRDRLEHLVQKPRK